MPILVNFYVSLALKAIEMMSVISLATKGDTSIVNGKAIDPSIAIAMKDQRSSLTGIYDK